MENKLYYCSKDSTNYKVAFNCALIAGIIAGLCLILILCPLVMYWIIDWFELEIGLFECYPILLIGLTLGGLVCFSNIRLLRRYSKNPTLEIDEESIHVANHNNGTIQSFYFKDIEKFEVSEAKLFGKVLRRVDVVAKKDSIERIISHTREKQNIAKINNILKACGAVEQVYELFVDVSIDAVHEELQKSLEEYNNAHQ